MNRISRLVLALSFGASVARAVVAEPIAGRLENGPGSSVVLTLDLASERLAELADKKGREADFNRTELGELIRERFHYLLRLRMAEREVAPTSVVLSAPVEGQPRTDFLTLTATWAGVSPALASAHVVTQTDVPDFRVILAVTDRRTAGTEKSLAANADTSTRPALWWRRGLEGLFTGVARVVPSGIAPFLFMLGLSFSARGGRELFSRLLPFSGAHALALGLDTSGVFTLGAFARHGIELVVALSLVAIAAVNCLNRRVSGRAWWAFSALAGGLHGLLLTQEFSDERGPESRGFIAVAGEILGVELTLLTAVGLAVWLAAPRRPGGWDRPELTVPASVVIGLGGLGWMLERVQGAWGFSP